MLSAVTINKGDDNRFAKTTKLKTEKFIANDTDIEEALSNLQNQKAQAKSIDGKIKSGASLDRCLCNHAEANAIMHCAILGLEAGVKGATLYSTYVPCLECTKMAITIGIKGGCNDKIFGKFSKRAT